LGGFQEKFSSLVQKQTPAYLDVRHDWNSKREWMLWLDETKKLLFGSCVWFGANRDKKFPMPTVKYTTGSLMLWAYFFSGGPGLLVQIILWILANTNRCKIKT